jgi:A/G-specific adenine glycosylase
MSKTPKNRIKLRTDESKYQSKLMRWFIQNNRPLPWRSNPTPYRVWISEIMLQQTQAATVCSYFNRFLDHFPDLESLANSPEKEILALWSGLGYYRRAKNIGKAAREICTFHNGVFPSDLHTIRSLPGVGRYTAGAICSLAFNQSQPIVDGNIRRVITRFNGVRDHIPEKYFWDQMQAWIPDGKASIFNQAVMELGALVCTPFQPRCHECPIRDFCKAKKLNLQTELPRPRPKKTIEKLPMIILIIERKNELLLTSEKPSFIPGFWGFPVCLVPDSISAENAVLGLSECILGKAIALISGPIVSHTIGNRRLMARVFIGKAAGSIRLSPERFRWIERMKSNEWITSSLFKKALKQERR